MIIVSAKGDGDYLSVNEAVSNIKEDKTIYVKNGIYHERVEITESGISLIGESKENTVIEYDLYAKMMLSDGKRGTFRSYTMLVNTNDFSCKNMTIANISGFGKDVGQAIAVYAEGDNIIFENCRILGHQDTLFTGPLPYKEYETGGFRGPTEFAERKQGHQLYRNCYIEGEVDFIFGSAAAYFDNCELCSIDCHSEINGYVTAASTYDGSKYGYVFNNCKFTGNCPPKTVYLGRPWRNYAKTVLLNCEIGDHIALKLFHDWNKKDSHETVCYALFNCCGKGFVMGEQADFVHILTEKEAAEYSIEKVLGENFKF